MSAKTQLRRRNIADEPRYVIGMDAHSRKLAISIWDWLGKAGPVPDERRLVRRVAQIGGGVIFGSREFVMAAIFGHGHCFAAAHVAAKPVEDWAFASHGQKLAEKGEKRLSLEIWGFGD